MNTASPADRNASRLPRVLGPWMATAIVIGTVIGSGVFKKPYAVSQSVNEFGLAMLAWVLVGLLALLGALTLAEIASLYPKAGGNYVFLREGYGRLAGFLWGWVDFWIIRSGSIAALASIFADSIHDAIRHARGVPTGMEVLSFWPRQGLTVSVILALALVNVRGVRWSGLLQLLVTLVKISSLVAIILLPFVVMGFVSQPSHPPSAANLEPVWPKVWGGVNWSKFLTAMVGVIWAYHGWMNIGSVAEEIKNPKRNIPLSLLLGQGIIILLYLGANFAYFLVIPHPEMKNLKDTTVATEFSVRLLGPIGGVLAATAIGVSVFGALNGNILVGPRLLYAMGDDGLAPRWLHAVHPRYKTPAAATLTLCLWSSLMVVLVAVLLHVRLPAIPLFGRTLDVNLPRDKSGFDVITDFAMFGAVALETLTVLTIFVFRRKYPDAERPYKCVGYPLTPAVYGLIMLAVWLNMFVGQTTESLVGIGFMVAGAALYLTMLRRR
jgi:amino acid transporter